MTQPDRSGQKKAGDVLVEEGLISLRDVETVLAIQDKNRLAGNRNRLFGMVLCDLGLITPMDNYCTLEKYGKLLSVKAHLVNAGIIGRARLDELCAQAGAEGIPLISFLLDKKVMVKSLLQQILFDLFYIPFRSVSDIVFEKESRGRLAQVIGQAAAEENQCIPLQLNGASLLVGITKPANLMFLRDLDLTFPQYRFTPVFIPFSGFTWFYRLLYEKNWEGGGKTVDLSLLMKSSMVICDPVADKEKILAFFDRYERVRSAGQEPAGGGRRKLFLEFIRHHHSRMAARAQCRRIRFSLKVEEDRLKLLAAPEAGEED